MKKLSLYIFLVLMFNNVGFAMEKKITCSLHEGYSHFASDSLNKSLIGKKIEILPYENAFDYIDIHSKEDLILANLIFKKKTF